MRALPLETAGRRDATGNGSVIWRATRHGKRQRQAFTAWKSAPQRVSVTVTTDYKIWTVVLMLCCQVLRRDFGHREEHPALRREQVRKNAAQSFDAVLWFVAYASLIGAVASTSESVDFSVAQIRFCAATLLVELSSTMASIGVAVHAPSFEAPDMTTMTCRSRGLWLTTLE